MSKEELLKKWVTEVLECEITKGNFKRIIKLDEYVKSRLSQFTFWVDANESDKDEVCLWIKEDLKALEMLLTMIDNGKINRFTLYNLEDVILW